MHKSMLTLALALAISAPATARDTAPLSLLELPKQFAPHTLVEDDADAVGWAALGDPVLTNLIAQAMVANTDVRQAQARLTAARARHRVTVRASGPSGGLAVASTEIEVAGNRAQNASVDLGVHWDIDLFGRLARERDASKSRYLAQAADLDGVHTSIAAELARTYLQWRGAQEELRIRREYRDAQLKVVEFQSVRMDEGMLTVQAFARSRAELASDEAELAETTDRVFALEASLAVLIGEAPGPWQGPDAPLLDDIVQRPVRVPDVDSVLKQRPDVRVAQAMLLAKHADAAAASAARFPRLSLTGLLSFLGGGFGNLFGSDHRSSAGGATLSWSPLELPRLNAQFAADRAETDVALAAYDGAVLRAISDVETALQRYGSAQQQAKARLRQAAEAHVAAQGAQARFEEGDTDYLDALTARRDALRAALDKAGALVVQRIAVVDVLHALGIPVSPSSQDALAGLAAASRTVADWAPAEHGRNGVFR